MSDSEATAGRRRLGRGLSALLGDWPAEATPGRDAPAGALRTMPITALKVGLEVPDEGDWGDDWTSWSPYTYPFNLTQQPACSSPGGLASNGLPIGVQIVGPPRGDRLVLRAARAVEQAMPMPRPPARHDRE